MKQIYSLFGILTRCVNAHTVCMIMISLLAVSLSAYGQNAENKVTVKAENQTVKTILAQIEKNDNIHFFFDEKKVDVTKIKSIDVTGTSLSTVLNLLFDGKVDYNVSENNTIVISPKKTATDQQNDKEKRSVLGVVTDEQGEPLIGVVVVGNKGAVTAITDVNGNFNIKNIDVSHDIMFICTGLITQHLKAPGDNQPLKVVMKENTIQIEEVIVTGFGNIKKSAYAGSASTLRTESISDVPVTSLQAMMQGAMSGVTVSQSLSGQPGASQTVRIRGVGSYNASNAPLYVIDGVPVLSGDFGTAGTAGTDIMATINPSDIETMSVIKDAAAASLYGSRAANGVVIITTKKGKKGAAKFSFKADKGFSDFAMQFRPYLSGDERREFIYDAMLRHQKYIKNNNDEASARAWADVEIDKVAPKPWSGWANWNDLLMRQGAYDNYEVSVSGATDKFTYYSSLSYSLQEGIQNTQYLDRISGRVNVSYQANKALEFGANILFSKIEQGVGYDGMEYNAPLYGALHKITDSDAPYNEDGTFNRSLLSNGKYNPLAVQLYNSDIQYMNRMNNVMYGQYTIIPELKLRTTLSYDYTVAKQKSWSDPNGSSDFITGGSASKNYYEYANLVWSTNLNYIKTFGKHTFDALVAYEINAYDSDYLSATSDNFLNPSKNEIGNGATIKKIGGYTSQYRMISYISKFNYDYDYKYFFGASYRMDGTSRLLRENRWGNFWSVSGAWRFSKENFMESLSNVITDGKLRFSYGANGTQPTDFYAGQNRYTFKGADYNSQSGQIEETIVSESLRWESNYNANLGIDITLYNKVNMSLELYTRTTKDLLFDCPMSLTTGMSSYLTNIGLFRNRGIEFEITSQNITKQNFQWTTSFNISHNQNRILKLDGDQEELKASNNQVRKIGHSYYTNELVEWAGSDPDTGAPTYYSNALLEDGTRSRDIVFLQKDATAIIWNVVTPKLVGGLTNNFKYSGFDLGFTFTFTLGGTSYDSAMQKSRKAGNGSSSAINQIPTFYRDSWKKPGDISDVEGWIYLNTNTQASTASTARVHSTDHLRLKNLTFGYTIPSKLTTKIGINKLRVYMAGTNMLTFAKYDMYDPEVPISGVMAYNTPPLKTTTFGIEITF